MKSEKRQSLIEKLKAIRERTVDRGCTEEEAMTAARLAAKLMAEYSLTMTDLEIGEERSQAGYIDTGRKRRHEIQWCLRSIAAFADVKCWFEAGSRRPTTRIVFFGLPQDVETATYLYQVIKGAMDREFNSYGIRCAKMGRFDWNMGRGFMLGMAARISERLYRMQAEQRQETVASTGRDLVVVKGAVVERDFKALGVKLRSSYSHASTGDRGSHAAGRDAGDRVGLDRSVGGGNGATIGLIGR